jgi:nicotinamidase/pyrazinamidase
MFGFLKKKKALIIVDVQNDFVPGGALAVPKGDEVVPYINGLLDKYELIVASKDWHPSDHCSFASAHPGHAVGERIDLDRGSQLLWPDHCVQDSKGAEFVPGLKTEKIVKTVLKGVDRDIDSYSALFDNDNNRSTGLLEYLKAQKADEVHIVGLATDYTVKYTAIDCKKAGLATVVLKDGCRAVNLNAGDHDRAIKEMERAGIQVK